MGDHGLDYLVNCSMLFTERPLLERPAAARAAGFDAIEFWWPWPEQPVPADAEVDAFVRAIRDAGVRLIGLNFFAGDLAGPDAGVLSIPDRSAQFRDNLDVAVGIGEQLDVTAFNALYGNRVDGVAAEQQDELARDNLGRAADAAARIGATVLVEPVSGPKPYPLRTADDAVAVVDAVRAAGHENVGFLCDLFHLANNGDDVDAAIARHADVTSHVQIADYPGRGEPGSGELDLDRHLRDLADRGYAGWVGLEYKPTTDTETSLQWLPMERRAAHGSDPRARTSMSTIGFIGLGIMGSPMAVHLQKAGHEVSGYNKRRDTAGPLVEAGGRKASSIADAVQGADVVAIMVPDSPDVQEVLTGPGGVFESAASGTLVIDFSSIRPDVTAELAQTRERARLPAARRARLRRRGRAPRTLRCRSWSAARPRTSRPPSRSSTRSARRSCMSAPAERARRSRRPTS